MPEGPTPPLVGRLAALGDMARLRLLRLLDREELSVGEVARALQLPQSTVSRHLKLLLEADFIVRRSEGTASFYRVRPSSVDDPAARMWSLASEQLETSVTTEEDDHRLAEVLASRTTDSRSFFGRVGQEWDHLRKQLFGDGFSAPALLGLLDPDLVVADLGCGTGNASLMLAPVVKRVIAVDRERSMLDAARAHLAELDNVEFRAGDLLGLPIGDGEVDAAVTLLVLHHLDDPGAAIREMKRVVRPGGALLLVDMVGHDRESYRHSMGHRHLGFAPSAIESMADEAGLAVRSLRRLRPAPESKGPGLFAAVLVSS